MRPEILLQGIQDALGDQPLAMSPIEMHQNMLELQNKVEAEEEKKRPDQRREESELRGRPSRTELFRYRKSRGSPMPFDPDTISGVFTYVKLMD